MQQSKLLEIIHLPATITTTLYDENASLLSCRNENDSESTESKCCLHLNCRKYTARNSNAMNEEDNLITSDLNAQIRFQLGLFMRIWRGSHALLRIYGLLGRRLLIQSIHGQCFVFVRSCDRNNRWNETIRRIPRKCENLFGMNNWWNFSYVLTRQPRVFFRILM